MTMKQINHDISRNETTRIRNDVRIKKLDGVYRRNLIEDLRNETQQLWRYQGEIAKKHPILTCCDHDHTGRSEEDRGHNRKSVVTQMAVI